MLTRLIRRQLVVFSVLGAGSLAFTSVVYADLPGAVGLRGYDVEVDFADVSGLYPRALVTFEGVEVGRVDQVDLDDDGAHVVLRIDGHDEIPAGVEARIHSTSAVGEQYVDLVAADDAGPFLEDGATIPRDRTTEMPQIGPVLERLDALLASVPQEETAALLDQVDDGLAGAGPDLGELVDTTTDLVDTARSQLDATTGLIEGATTLLATQQDLAGPTAAYSTSLASFTTVLAGGDAEVRALLADGPAAVAPLTAQLRDVSPTLPTLLANLTTNGRVLDVYLPHVEQTLVAYPALLAGLLSAVNPRLEEGDVQLDLRATVNDPPSCVEGYVPVDQRRSPTDTTTRETDGEAHCEAPPTGRESVRGLRNLPCPTVVGGRGASPAECGLVFPGAADADGRPRTYVPVDPATGELVTPDGLDVRVEPNTQGGGDWSRVLTDVLAGGTP